MSDSFGVAVGHRAAVGAGSVRAFGGVWRTGAALFVVSATLALVGCAANPKSDEEAKALPARVEPLTEFLSRAQAAEGMEGGRDRARLIYRDAAKAYPTDKRPWLRLAQSYFDGNDYGNAVLAAQEVVQRDPADNVAQGLLAVSGLRISTSALSALRSHNSLNGSPRSEAEEMARNLRSVLGESVLVPKPADGSAAQAATDKPAPKAKPRTRASARAASPAVIPKPATTPAASSNPFGALQ